MKAEINRLYLTADTLCDLTVRSNDKNLPTAIRMTAHKNRLALLKERREIFVSVTANLEPKFSERKVADIIRANCNMTRKEAARVAEAIRRKHYE
jgi:tRNA A37 threonylcarbamoyladenosine synthetase subunit TsaC/SUA5/YrdC